MNFLPSVKRLKKHNRILKRMLMDCESRERTLETKVSLLEQTIRNNEIEIDILRRYLGEIKKEKVGE